MSGKRAPRAARWMGIALAFTFLAVGSHAAAQPSGYPGCSESPDTCDPQVVNGGVKTYDEPVTTLLYAHAKDIIQQAPLNTQAPHPDHERDLDQGFLMPTLFSDNPVCCRFNNNEFTWFMSPGPVEYLADGEWRVHQEPQLDAPIHVVGDVVGYAYFSADSVPDTVPASEPSTGIMPAVGVYMRMETGRNLGEGTLIAEGDTGLGYGSPELAQLEGTTTMVSRPGDDPVYEFAVRMPLKHPVIENQTGREAGFIVTMRPYQLHVDGQAAVTSAEWRIRTGADYPHRVHLTHQPTLRDVGAEVRVAGNKLAFDWLTLSSFGSYDVNLTSFNLRLEGPLAADGTGPAVPGGPAEVRLPYHGHGSAEPTNASWRTVEAVADLADGTYHARASVMNAQATYRLERNATIVVQDGHAWFAGDTTALEGEAVSGLGVPATLAVAVLAAGMLLDRPRRRSGKP